MKWNHALTATVGTAAGIFLIFVIVLRFYSLTKKNFIAGDSLSLITEPDDGIAPVLALIRGASRSVDLVMYELDDARVESALVADEGRGVAVRVILSAGYQGASSSVNAAAYNFLAANGVPVRWSPSYFSLTHEKSLVVDGDRALIMTFNLVSKYYATGRDFGIIDSDLRDVAAITRTFNTDWQGSSGTASGDPNVGGNNGDAGDDLIWSPGSEAALINLIGSAEESLCIYNEEMADAAVVKALIDAAERGVAVYIDMTGASEWKWEFEELATAGAHVRTYPDTTDAPLYIHAKMIVADGARAFVGSENFSTASLDDNRELGIMISNQDIVASLTKTFAADWRGATPFVP
ncbi:MAG TPA: phospholipase D-like domain-containing protein [Candidatus Paceibacterota bacterium]|nr:phospholipase D-like domain-containing protein [Candidatus Paceibacterota bacterium]